MVETYRHQEIVSETFILNSNLTEWSFVGFGPLDSYETD